MSGFASAPAVGGANPNAAANFGAYAAVPTASAVPSWINSVMPAATGAVGDIASGVSQKTAADYNAQAKGVEARAAINQGAAQEYLTGVKARAALGRTAAAGAQAGTGSGAIAGIEHQSAVNAELDKYATMYRGAFTAYGYNASSKADSYEGDMGQGRGLLLAGGRLLKAINPIYQGSPLAENS